MSCWWWWRCYCFNGKWMTWYHSTKLNTQKKIYIHLNFNFIFVFICASAIQTKKFLLHYIWITNDTEFPVLNYRKVTFTETSQTLNNLLLMYSCKVNWYSLMKENFCWYASVVYMSYCHSHIHCLFVWIQKL